MSNLDQYLTESKTRQEDFAAEVGTTQATVSRLARGLMKPGLELAVAIHRATNGAVPVDGWVSANPQPATPERQGAN